MSSSLDAAFYPALLQAGKRGRFDPADALLVFTSESGLDPRKTNGRYHGLNQLSGNFLRSQGVDPADYLTWPASQQIALVERYFAQGHRFGPGRGNWPNAAVLYQSNWLPGTVFESTSPAFLLVSKDGQTDSANPEVRKNSAAWYRDNVALDFDRDGFITVADLARRLASIANGGDDDHGTRGAGQVFQDALTNLNRAKIAMRAPRVSGFGPRPPPSAWPWTTADVARLIRTGQLDADPSPPSLPEIADEPPLPGHDGQHPLVPAVLTAPEADEVRVAMAKRTGAKKELGKFALFLLAIPLDAILAIVALHWLRTKGSKRLGHRKAA
jgi:hypothetical protein